MLHCSVSPNKLSKLSILGLSLIGDSAKMTGASLTGDSAFAPKDRPKHRVLNRVMMLVGLGLNDKNIANAK